MSAPAETNTEFPAPLDIKCTSADCGNDLHCFKATRKLRAANHAGVCRYCGADLVDWRRIHRRDILDAAFTFEALQHELIRHHFWHLPIDSKAESHARRKGRAGLEEAAAKRIRSSIGGAMPFRDGYQTPKSGNVLFYAQHATATCCRTCLEYWHDVPKGRPLDEDEVGYLADLVMRYVDQRLPLPVLEGDASAGAA